MLQKLAEVKAEYAAIVKEAEAIREAQKVQACHKYLILVHP